MAGVSLQPQEILRDRYQLCTKLGHNAGRQTWKALDLQKSPSETVIVKLLAFEGEADWQQLKLFEREGMMVEQLDHPRLPVFRDCFDLDGQNMWLGLVQAYIPGTCLRDLINQGKRFSEEEIKRIATEILEILIYLHQLHPAVLHRDIKPSNLIWGTDGEIYLIDLGAVQDKAPMEGSTFTVVGTYGYTPIEQFGGRAVPSSDLYALGATLIHLLSGVPPANLPQDKMRLRFSDLVNISEQLHSWLTSLTEPDFKDRPASAQQALDFLTQGLPSRTISNPISPIQKPEKIRNQIRFSKTTFKIITPGSILGIFPIIISAFFFWLFWIQASRIYELVYGPDSIFNNSSNIMRLLIFALIVFIIGSFAAIAGLWKVSSSEFQIQKENESINIRKYKKIFRKKIKTHQRSNSSLNSIFHVQSVQHNFQLSLEIEPGSIRDLILQTEDEDYRILAQCRRNEANWLIQEIQGFLL